MTALSYRRWSYVKSIALVSIVLCIAVSLVMLIEGTKGLIACFMLLLLLGLPLAGLYAEALRRVQAYEDQMNRSFSDKS